MGKKLKGEINFYAIDNQAQAMKKYHVWEDALKAMHHEEMPPEDELQPSAEEKAMFKAWYTKTFIDIEAKPSIARLQRLSVFEYRESLKSLLGFDLILNLKETGETVQERSLVVKMMPPDLQEKAALAMTPSKVP